jgi:SlyX protein
VSTGARWGNLDGMDTLEPRLVDLELRFMKLERYAQELSDVVAEQQRRIEALTLETKRLRERAAQGEPAAGNDRPPHY